jgi:pre-mRNA-splicing factor SPF27
LHGGIDLTRYEAPDEPASDTPQEAWRQALRNAYVSSTYLSGRHSNLTLLDEFGKNAWLIGNSQLEHLLQELEGELARLRDDVENVNKARKAAQENSRGELLGLEETWRLGIGKILEVQVAEAGLRRLILERRNNHGSLSA